MSILEKQLIIDSPIEILFSVLTTSNEIVKYFPLKEVISDWNVGAEVLYKGEVEDVPFTDYGKIIELSAPHTYAYQYWSDNHGTERSEENLVTIRYELQEIADRTQLTLIQENLPTAELYDLMNDKVWDFLLNELKQFAEKKGLQSA